MDAAPGVADVLPGDAATGVAVNTALTVIFTEPMTPAAGWLRLRCNSTDYAITIASADATTYTATPTTPLPHAATCRVAITAALVHDADSDDPPDTLAADYSWSFATVAPVADFVLINELDSDTPGSDTAEFVELYDGGAGETDLSGLVLVFYNGSDDRSYYAVDLAGVATDDDGYAIIGSAALAGAVTLPASVIQNGPDAVSLYEGDADDFPSGTALTTTGLRDALVYGTSDPTDTGLLLLLVAGQTQVDENARALAETDSSGRCPNASGGLRQTAGYRPNPPTPGAPNDCHVDAPPAVVTVSPADGSDHVSAQATLEVQFSEAMTLDDNWFGIVCDASGSHAATTAGGPTVFTLTPAQPFNANERCAVNLRAAAIHDADSDDPPDTPAADYVWHFRTAPAPVGGILINELDSDTSGNDTAEFVELYDGGAGETDLSGLVLVFFNGKDDRVYLAVDLDGARTNGDGYAVVGSAALAGAVTLPASAIQNGPDAVSLYEGDAGDFPNGTALTTTGSRDAVVYGTSDPTDNGLLALLIAGQEQVDENARAAAETDSSGRCPNASGGLRQTATYRQNPPTPGAPNSCPADAAPAIVAVSPVDGAEHVAASARLQVQFSEAAALDSNWFAIACAASGNHAAATEGGPVTYTLTPVLPFTAGEACTITIRAAAVRDADSDDPPDGLAADYTWRFHVAPAAVDGILINEVDSDTPGQDTAEFVELYDGGRGHTDLSGLVVVLWNGGNDTTYEAIDLTGQQTDAAGYFVLGSGSLAEVDYPLADAALQNGPDAVALYAADPAAFPDGAPLTTAGLRDAVVYGPADEPDSGLLALLEAGQPQVDEAGRGEAVAHALQRCPSGDGGPRHTAAF
ncbi:MAG: Ig-like domain-containing protein, partial [Candidatus Promineofilum sp.]|nr:Ig-like domain-containing protein [Promineifilum sp.]